MVSYFLRYPQKIIRPFTEHISITTQALFWSLLLAAVLTLLLLWNKKAGQAATAFFSGIYCIPSLALFALLIPFLGLGRRTALFVLIVYNQFFLLRSFLSGLNNVEPHLTEAAYGMGLGRMQVLLRVRLPLALPSLLAGIRLAAVSTVGIAVIGASINAGGLGTLLFEGMRTRNTVKILWGVLLAALLNLLLNGILFFLEHLVRKKIHVA